MILIKDTHVKRCGGPANALKKALDFRSDKKDLKIEVEVQSFEEFLEAAQHMPDRIKFDNMYFWYEGMRGTYRTFQIELEGNITLSNIASVAATGVDFISSGAITSAPALDIHLVTSRQEETRLSQRTPFVRKFIHPITSIQQTSSVFFRGHSRIRDYSDSGDNRAPDVEG